MKSCLGPLVFGLLLAAAYYFFFLNTRTDFPADVILSILAGLLVGAMIYSLPRAYVKSREATLFQKAMTDQTTLEDGKLTAVAGWIMPEGQPLLTPFQQRECVAYEYQDSQSTGPTAFSSGYLGFAVTNCSLRTATTSIRLQGHPKLTNFQEETPYVDAAAVLRSLHPTEFQGPRLPETEISAALREIRENPGVVKRDWKRAGPEAAGAPLERYLKVGEKVCVLGTYSERDRSLTPKYPMTFGSQKRLIASTPDELLTQMRASMVPAVVGIVFFNLLLLGGVTLYDRKGRDPMDLIMAVESGDVRKVDHMIRKGHDPNAPERDGETPLFFARTGPVAMALIDAGAIVNPPGDKRAGQTPLMKASENDDRDVVRILLDHGANTKARGFPPCERTALSYAIKYQNTEVEHWLLERGAPDDRVTASNGTPLPQDGGEPFAVVQQYLAALQARDESRMHALRLVCVDDFYSAERLEEWRNSHPLEPVFDEGYTNGTSASLRVSGVNREGKNYWRDYLLVHRPNGWIIREEW